MGIEEEFSGQPSDRRRVLPMYRRARSSGTGRIRYARSGAPLCAVSSVSHAGAWHDALAVTGGDGAAGDGAAYAEPGAALGAALGRPWSAEFPVAGRRNDLWVLVCGGIAAAAAFTAAFVASGGVTSHPATPGTLAPAVSQSACPSPAPSPRPAP